MAQQNVYRVTVQIHHPALGGIGTNTWHCFLAGAHTDDIAELTGLSQKLESFYEGVAPLFPDTTAFTWDGIATGIGGEHDTMVQTPLDWTVVGSVAGGCLPPAVCLVIGWRTALASKHGRGRTFLSPLAIAVNEGNGTPTESARDTAHDAADVLIPNEDNLDGSNFGVYSQMEGFHVFTAGVTRNLFGSLRSRRD